MRWTSLLLDGLLPSQCLGCGAAAGSGQRLCAGCAADLPAAIGGCARCAAPGPAVARCARCRRRPPAFDAVAAALRYAGPVPVLLGRFKYRGDLAAGACLAEIGARTFAAEPRPDVLLPVPLHPARLRTRGFNQAMELASGVGRALGIGTDAGLCERVRNTPAQAGLGSRRDRQRNLDGAFRVRGRGSVPRHVAIVDDVMTTGATLDALARCVRDAGATRIVAWVAARA